MATLVATRAARKTVSDLLKKHSISATTGIGGTDSDYHVKVKLYGHNDFTKLPEEVDGVKVVVERVSKISKRKEK